MNFALTARLSVDGKRTPGAKNRRERCERVNPAAHAHKGTPIMDLIDVLSIFFVWIITAILINYVIFSRTDEN